MISYFIAVLRIQDFANTDPDYTVIVPRIKNLQINKFLSILLINLKQIPNTVTAFGTQLFESYRSVPGTLFY